MKVWTRFAYEKLCVLGAAAPDAAGTSTSAPSASDSARRRYLWNMNDSWGLGREGAPGGARGLQFDVAAPGGEAGHDRGARER